MQSQLWENEEMTDEEAEELERQAVLLKIKMTRASERIKQWGMETGLSRCHRAICSDSCVLYPL
jgi:hypothetical protein